MEEKNLQEGTEEREGLSFREIFRIIKKRVWAVLGAAAAGALIVVLVLAFAFNPAARSYSMQFTLVFPTRGEALYPDGSPFFYQDYASVDFLTAAKNADESLSRIDVSTLSGEDDITVTEAARTDNTPAGQYTYTIHAKSSYFSSARQAETFIRALANVPVLRMKAAAAEVSFCLEEEVFKAAPFEERLLLLEDVKETLLAQYDAWIESYSETYRVTLAGQAPGRLKDFRASVIALYGESVQRELENELDFGGYYSGNLAAYTAQLRLEYAQNEAEIVRLKEALSSTRSYARANVAAETQLPDIVVTLPEDTKYDLSERLAELITRNNRIDHWINVSGTVQNPTLTEENVANYALRLKAEYDKLAVAAETLTKVTTAIYNGMSVRFAEQTVTTEGGISLAIGGIGGLVLGFAIAAVVVCSIELSKKGKREEGSAQDTAQQ